MTEPSGEARAREPKPKPLIIAVMLVAIIGGSCTLQTIAAGEAQPPSQAQVELALKQMGPLTRTRGPEEQAQMASAFLEFTRRQVRVATSLQPFHLGFGIVLIATYAFAFLFGLRALALAREAPSQLSLAALFALIARVAVAAIDVAQAQKLRPAWIDLAKATSPPPGFSPEQAAQMIQAAGAGVGWIAVAFEMTRAFAVCVLLSAAWRYFQRPDVVAYFDRHSPADPLE